MFSLFSINVTLTNEGILNVNDVLDAIFSFLLVLKETSIEDHEKAFMELKQIKDTTFKYREEKTATDNVEELAVNMMYYDHKDILTGPDILFKFDGALVQDLISRLNERKFNLLLLTDKHGKFEKTEKWFGTEYDEVGEFTLNFNRNEKYLKIHSTQTFLKVSLNYGTIAHLSLSFPCLHRTNSSVTISKSSLARRRSCRNIPRS